MKSSGFLERVAWEMCGQLHAQFAFLWKHKPLYYLGGCTSDIAVNKSGMCNRGLGGTEIILDFHLCNNIFLALCFHPPS